jgi:hypothetical protein
VHHLKKAMIIYTYIESDMQFEDGTPIGYQAYIVLCNLPYSSTFENIDNIHYQYDLNETNT